MRRPSQLFCSTLFAVGISPGLCSSAQHCLASPRAIVSDACASYATVDRLNAVVKPAIDSLVQTTDVFSHYRLNLFHKECPFWSDSNGMCGNQACAVLTLDNEAEIPEVWRASELSKLKGPPAQHPGTDLQKDQPIRPLQGKHGKDVGQSYVDEYDDEFDNRDYCVPEDESFASKGDYVSLLENPERFTGYAGAGARQVWNAIYQENCFQKSSFPKSADLGISLEPVPRGRAALDIKQVLEDAGRQQALEQYRQHSPLAPFVAQTGLELDDDCLEKRVFYRIISGMHASISTHLCWDFFNQTSGEWHSNVECYRERLHDHPERISNLYFNFALVTRAVAKLGPSLQSLQYIYCSMDSRQNTATGHKLASLAAKLANIPPLFDESIMFKNGEGLSLKEDFRNRFRNVSRLMDCVGCDKCRLWGKIQTAGYGTALKVLFETQNDQKRILHVTRTELVALFNTYARISNSLNKVGIFREMIQDYLNDEPVVEPDKVQAAYLTDEPPKKEEKQIYSEQQPQLEDGTETEQPDSFNAVFQEELSRIIKAFRIVLRGWVNMPSWIWHICSTESTRLWQFYIGLPIRPRTWKFARPDLDEL